MSKLQLDGNKLIHHIDRINQWSRGELITPIYIAFSPTSYCNHHCIFCVYNYKTFKPIFFSIQRYQTLVNEWAQAGVRSIFFAGDGEPLLNKQCHEMVRFTKKAGIDVALNTNGRLLQEVEIPTYVENLSFVRISLNAGSAKNYAFIHGANEKDFDIVMNNVESLVKVRNEKKSKMTIGIQLVLLSHNLHEIKSLALKLKNIGVDYFSIKPFLKHPNIAFDDSIENLELILDDLLVFQKEITTEYFTFSLRKGLFIEKLQRNYKKCQSTEFMVEVDALGDIYSCGPYIGDPNHKLGNIMNDSFETVWNSDQSKKARQYVACDVDVSTCMSFCRPDSVNDFLWKLTNPPQHVNYI